MIALKPEQQKLLDTLKYAWLRYPELRLGQLLENVVPHVTAGVVDVDLFYVTDEELRRRLEKYKP